MKNLNRDVNRFMATTPIRFNLREHLLRLVTEKFGKVEDVRMYSAATLLDPRFTKVGFTADERSPMRIANAIYFFGGLVQGKMTEAADAVVAAAQVQPEAATNDDYFWGDFDREVQTHAATMSNQDMAGGIHIQLRMYLDRPPVNRLANSDPLAAWDAFKAEYREKSTTEMTLRKKK
ncbi:Uridylate kinase [Frankliniella fusca]|uniref:Uridylate kinase n=1 Tax=Frankliniella fusca TaxID=407009 RepID=A0AAE1LJA6_9NEOP|nr:Uridylate kinase [Frankliniella fusca]